MTDSHWLADLETLIGRSLIDNDDATKQMAVGARELLASVSDEKIRQAYIATDGEQGDPLVDILLAAIQDRGIDL